MLRVVNIPDIVPRVRSLLRIRSADSQPATPSMLCAYCSRHLLPCRLCVKANQDPCGGLSAQVPFIAWRWLNLIPVIFPVFLARYIMGVVFNKPESSWQDAYHHGGTL